MTSANDDDVVSQRFSHQQFTTANIYKCLAPCNECNGNYISELLQKRFVCYCRCHEKIAENYRGLDSTTTLRFTKRGGGEV
jgi:hypothetical protein